MEDGEVAVGIFVHAYAGLDVVVAMTTAGKRWRQYDSLSITGIYRKPKPAANLLA